MDRRDTSWRPTGTASSSAAASGAQNSEWHFIRKPMVSWFAPATLTNAAVRAILTSTIGQYGDRRDFQIGLGNTAAIDLAQQAEIWIDYVADSGDGFESTFAVARVMAEEELGATRRGSIILFGGDQVYPDAHNHGYRDRFIGPFDAAFRHVTTKPRAFLIPGNHDWYDGLVEFMSLFCGGEDDKAFRRIKTPQQRSYWALKLPHDWYCLGLDWHIGVSMDLPQREYFRAVIERIKSPSRFILIVPNPVWVQYFQGKREEYRELEKFIEMVTRQSAGHGVTHTVELVLSGDLHCYARYSFGPDAGDEGRQLIMAGGGGAYLYPVHGLPGVGRNRVRQETLAIGDAEGATPSEAPGLMTAKMTYPDPSITSRLAWKAIGLPVLNPALMFLLIGPLYLLLNYIFRRAEEGKEGTDEWLVWQSARFDWNSLFESVQKFWNTAYTLSGLMTATIVIVALGVWAYKSQAGSDGTWKFRGAVASGVGAAHGIVHILAACVSVWMIAAFRCAFEGTWWLTLGDIAFLLLLGFIALMPRARAVIGTPVACAIIFIQLLIISGLVLIKTGAVIDENVRAQIRIPLLSLQVIVFGGLLGTFLLGVYLALANFFGGHANDSLACQSIGNYKNFVRMHIDPEGRLEIYPFGIDSPPARDEWVMESGRWRLSGANGRVVRNLATEIDPNIATIGTRPPPASGGQRC